MADWEYGLRVPVGHKLCADAVEPPAVPCQPELSTR
jgi:hypothetical protein